MAQLKKVGGDNQFIQIGESVELMVQAVEPGEEPVQVSLSSRSDDVELAAAALTLTGEAPGTVQCRVPAGDKKHIVDAVLAGAEDEASKVSFSVRSIDPDAVTLQSTLGLINDLTNLEKVADQSFSRRIAEELRAILQAVRNIEEKVKAREDALPDAGLREVLVDRLRRLQS